MGSDQVNKRSPLKPGSWEFAFSDMFVYVCEGAYVIPVFHPRDALNALVVALAFYSKEAGAGARPQLVPFHTRSSRRMKPLELAVTNSVRSSIPRSRYMQVRHSPRKTHSIRRRLACFPEVGWDHTSSRSPVESDRRA